MNVLRHTGIFASIAGAVLFSCASTQGQIMIRRSGGSQDRARADRSKAEVRAKRLEAQIKKLTAELRKLKALKKAGSHRRSRHEKSKEHDGNRGRRRFGFGRPGSRGPATRPSRRGFDRREMRERMEKMMKARMGQRGATQEMRERMMKMMRERMAKGRASSEMRERMMKMWKARMAQRKDAGPKASHGKRPSHKKPTASGLHIATLRKRGKSHGERTDHRSKGQGARLRGYMSRLHRARGQGKDGPSRSKRSSKKARPSSHQDGLRRIIAWYRKLPREKQEDLRRRFFAAAKAFREAGEKGHRPHHEGKRGPSMPGHGRRKGGMHHGMRGMRGRSMMRRMWMHRGRQGTHGMRRGKMHGGFRGRMHGMRRGRMHGMRGGMRRGMQHGPRRMGWKGTSAKGKGGCPSGNCPMSRGGMKRGKHHRRF